MQSDKHLIEFDSGTSTYLTGTTIHGSIKLLCSNKGKKIRGVCFRIVGRGKCGWTALQQKRSPAQQTLPNDDATAGSGVTANFPVAIPTTSIAQTAAFAENQSSSTAAAASAALADTKTVALQYTGKEVYLDETVYLVGSKNGPSFSIHPENNTFEFAFSLATHLPSSFKGKYGKIKYYIEFIVHLPWRFDEFFTVPLNVQYALDLNAQLHALQPYQHQQTRVIGMIHSGPVSLHVYAPRRGCATGDRLPIQVIVTNRSSTHVDRVTFTLVQLIEYHSTSPARYMRTESLRVLRKVAGGVEKKAEQKYEHLLEIPDDLPATRTGQGIINIRYEIRVEAKMTGLYRSLVEKLSFVVASLPYFDAGATTVRGAATDIDISSAAPPPRRTPAAIGWQPSMNGSFASGETPTPSVYPSMQSLPNAILMSPPYTPPQQHPHQHPPNYAQSMSTQSTGAFNRGSVGRSSMRSSGYASPSAPPLDFSTPIGSTRSSMCSSVQVWDTEPPSYEQVYGAAEEFSSESGTSSDSLLAASFRRKQEPHAM